MLRLRAEHMFGLACRRVAFMLKCPSAAGRRGGTQAAWLGPGLGRLLRVGLRARAGQSELAAAAASAAAAAAQGARQWPWLSLSSGVLRSKTRAQARKRAAAARLQP